MTEDEYKSLSRMIKKANNRLMRLEKFSDKNVSWAGKQLQSKIDNEKVGAWSRDNLIQISKDMSDLQLQRVYKATSDFLNSKASTISGVKNIMKKTTRNIGVSVGVSRDEAESLYQMLTDDTFKYIKENSSATSSDIWYVITEAKERRFNGKAFLKHMYEIADVIPDREMTDNIQALFIKEVLGAE